MPNARDDPEKWHHSDVASGSIKQHSHCRKHFDIFLKPEHATPMKPEILSLAFTQNLMHRHLFEHHS